MNKLLLQHIGIIMDGNRRWAKQHKVSVNVGHEEGAVALRKVTLHAIERGVKYLSVYVFSTENWQRTEAEVGSIMKLVIEGLKRHLKEFDKAGARICFLGDRENIDKNVLRMINNAEEKTKNNKKITISLCFNYGGQLEIVEAVKKIINSGVRGEMITEQTVADNLYYPEIPPVDIIVRTSGEKRLSNFMLWRAAYSELMFVDKMWPDFNETDLDEVINEYANRQRRFGA
jgi:undecaprenyl diphosphate synthase